jgi:hypothetical protein
LALHVGDDLTDHIQASTIQRHEHVFVSLWWDTGFHQALPTLPRFLDYQEKRLSDPAKYISIKFSSKSTDGYTQTREQISVHRIFDNCGCIGVHSSISIRISSQ